MKKKVPVRGHAPRPLTLITSPVVWDLVVVDGGAVRIAGRDERPCVAIWSTRGKVLSVQPSLGAALPLAEGYAEARAVSGGAPTEIHVERADLVAAVQAVVGDGVKVSWGASVEARALAQRLLDGLAPVAHAAKIDTFLAFSRAPRELVDQFARQALALGALAPWSIVPSDGDALLVHTPGLAPPTSTVLITGQLGESFAVLVFDAFDDVRAFQTLAENRGDAPPSKPGAAFHAISFDEADDLGPEIVARLKRAGYPVPWKGRFPVPMFAERYDAPSPVSPGALLRLTVVADALRQFFAQRGREIEGDLYAHVSLTGETRVSGAPRPWTVEYPHPSLGDDDDEGDDDGRHPLSRAETLRDLPGAFAPALSLLRQQRVILGEVVDVHEGDVVVHDLVDGARYTVCNVPQEQVRALRRWFYLFVQVVPITGGRWGYLSLLTAQERFVEALWPTFEETLRDELQALGRPAGGRDLHALLLREAGVAHAVFVRLGEAARARPKRRYLENSDGDRVEFIALTVQLPGTAKTVRAALDAMPELEQMDPSTWGWIDRSRTTTIPAGEALAVIETRRRGCTVSVNSPARADRAFALLRARFGDEVVEVKRTIESPWKQVPGIVAEKGDGVEVQVIANGPMLATAGSEPGSPRELFDRYVLRSLHEHVPMVGGVPREVAKTPEGRDRVERWLRDFETRGAPGEGGYTFFDADPLRRALGLTPITSR